MQSARWADKGSSLAFRVLAQNNRNGNNSRQTPFLPDSLYSDVIAPFLQFCGPLPNQLYAIGGRNQDQEPLNTVEMFDTWNGKWVTCPNMLCYRAGCSAAALPSGELLVVGGYNERGIVEGLLDSYEVFDPAQQTWRPSTSKLNRARWGHGSANLNGLVYCVGGCSLRLGAPAHEAFMETLRGCEVFDPSTSSWTQFADLNIARAGARVVCLGERLLAAVGGCDDVFGRAELLNSVELFDVRLGRWVLLSPHLTVPRTTAAVAAIDENQILIMGGAPSLATAEVYRVSNEVASPQCSRTANASAGSSEGGSPCRVCHVGNMAEGRMGCQAAALMLPAPGKKFPVCNRPCVVVVGGESGDEELDAQVRQFNSVLVYDVDGDSWRPAGSFPPIPTSRTAMALCVGPGLVTSYA